MNSRKYAIPFLVIVSVIVSFFYETENGKSTDRDEFKETLTSHEFYLNRNESEINEFGLPPDKAFEQDFLHTMDPQTGKPEPTRLESIYQFVNQKLTLSPALPGIGSSNAWVERGPNNVGGRTRTLLWDPNDVTGKKVWAGAVGGGLWYNNDITSSSSSWQKVNDFWDNISVSCMAVDPNNSQIFYVGTGEPYARASRGSGIWKTTNGGASFTKLSTTTSFYYINDIAIRNEGGASVVYAAVDAYYYKGTYHGAAQAGLQRSSNGGSTWAQVLVNIPNETTNFVASDVELAADNRIWIGSKASPYALTDRGGGRVLYSDDGVNWTISNSTSVSNGDGRVEVACAASDMNYVYAMVEDNSEVETIIRTANKGSVWSSMSEPDDDDNGISSSDFSRGQAWYDLILEVSPTDKNNVIAGAINLHMSSNGGTSWSQISKWSNNPGMGSKPYSYVHADQHEITFKPGSGNELVFGCDGGVFYTNSLSSAATSSVITERNNNYNVTQFYACAIHPTAGSNVFLAGAQDNGTQMFGSAGLNSTTEATGGDGAFCFIDQVLPNNMVTSYVYNNYYLSNNAGSSFGTLLSDDNTGFFINTADYDDNKHVLYTTKDNGTLYRVLNVSGSFASSTINLSGVSDMAKAIKVSPHTTSSTTLFIGTETGEIFKVTGANSSTSPTTINITGSNLPSGTVSCIQVGTSENELIATYMNYGVVSVWYTSNGGSTWINKEGNLPDMPVRWALFNPLDNKEVLLATEVGVWGSVDFNAASPTWTPSNSGLANVRVDMLQYRTSDNEVIAATFGRGVFSSSGFTLGATPVANFSYSQKSICSGDTVYFTDLSSGSPTQFSWDFGGGIGDTTNVSLPYVVFNGSGPFSISLTVSNSQGSDTKTISNLVEIGVNQISVNINTDNYGSETTWQILDGQEVIVSGGPYTDVSGGQNLSFTECLRTGCYKFKIFDSAGDGICCGFGNGSYAIVEGSKVLVSGGQFLSVDSGQFCIPAGASPPLANFSSSTTVGCAGDTIYFYDNSINAPTSWNWSFYGGVADDSTAQNPYVVYNASGVYNVSLKASNANGSNTKTVTGNIIIKDTPVATVLNPGDYCSNENLKVGIASLGTGIWMNSWDTIKDTAIFNPNIIGVGTYSSKFSVLGLNGCIGSNVVNFEINQSPAVSFTIADSACQDGALYTFTEGTPTGGTYKGYNVVNGSFDPTSIGTGVYGIKYVYQASNGCSDSVNSNLIVKVCVTSINEQHLNNSFEVFPTPVSNFLYIKTKQSKSDVNLKLLDIKGQLIFEKNVISFESAMKFDLSEVSSGTYFLRIEQDNQLESFRIIKTK